MGGGAFSPDGTIIVATDNTPSGNGNSLGVGIILDVPSNSS